MGVRNHRYSTLDQINVNNIANMKPAWSFSFGDEKQRGQETQALIHDGVIYVTASYSRAFALDAKTGKRLWSYSHRLPDDIRPCCDVVNRGGALLRREDQHHRHRHGQPRAVELPLSSGPNGDWKPYDSLFTSGQIYIEPSTGEPVGFSR